jgi:hypothetical protein
MNQEETLKKAIELLHNMIVEADEDTRAGDRTDSFRETMTDGIEFLKDMGEW